MRAKPEQRCDGYAFGNFRLDFSERMLWCEDAPVPLRPKQLDLLSYFVENAGRTVRKAELLDAVWPETYVEESTLARNVSWLRAILEVGSDGERMIETVPKVGYRFTANTRPVSGVPDDVLIVEEREVQYFRKQESITVPDAARQVVNTLRRVHRALSLAVIALVALIAAAFVLYLSPVKSGERSDVLGEKIAVAGSQSQFAVAQNDLDQKGISPTFAHANLLNGNLPAASADSQIRIGSIIHLRSNLSEDAGYLDAWGLVKSKPEFAIVPTELMFVSTHPNPNRHNGSGSWEIASATGKKEGEPLEYGDRVHLRNLHPGAGYLDNCGWIKDMPVFKDFRRSERFAVFTAYSEDRDAGTGTWIVGSDSKYEGDPVLAADTISLENGFSAGGYLNAAGRVTDIPAFGDYDGLHLVFIRQSSSGRHPRSGTWTISFVRSTAN